MALNSRKLLLEDGDRALTTRSARIQGTTQPSGQKLISFDEVTKHKTSDDCWVIIEVCFVSPDKWTCFHVHCVDESSG